MNAEVGPCLVAVKDLSYLTYEISYLRSSVGPVAKIRVTNTGSLMVEGSIHALLEKVTPGFRVINPDGDYLDSPFVTLPSTALAPGESAEMTVQFDTQSTGAVPEFHVRLISGLSRSYEVGAVRRSRLFARGGFRPAAGGLRHDTWMLNA